MFELETSTLYSHLLTTGAQGGDENLKTRKLYVNVQEYTPFGPSLLKHGLKVPIGSKPHQHMGQATVGP